MNILSIDLGKYNGISVYSNEEFAHKEEYKMKGYHEFYSKVQELVDLWKPSLILIPYPTRFYRVILAHSKLMGIVELIADKHQIQVIEVQDSTCKKEVLGSGKAKKEDIMKYFNEESEHISDSMLFTKWYINSIN